MKNSEKFIEKAKKMHGNKYDYSKSVYVKANNKICIICPEHGEFWQSPSEHARGCGCPKCCGNEKLTKEQFILKARNMHGWKYDYSKVEYSNNKTKVCIICPEHGEFWQTPHSHLHGKGCPNCCKRNKKYTTNEFIAKAKEIHGNKYDYSKIEYIDAKTKVCIICPEHGEFWQTPASHLDGKGCEKCVRTSYDTESFIKCSKNIHGEKYDYSKVEYVNTKEKVCIICPEHGEFFMKPNVHLQGCGCSMCLKKGEEKLFLQLVEKFGIDNINRQQTFDWLRNPKNNYHQYLDFYIPKYNIAIELQGTQHFCKHRQWDKTENDYIKRNMLDYNKKQLCQSNGIKILYFSFDNRWDSFFGEKVYHNIDEIEI